MALGYEGYIKVGGKYALGTGTSVPRARVRMDSSSGYGGAIKANVPVGKTVAEIGIGAPRTYDWETHDGSVNFELNRDFWINPLNVWVFDRQSPKEVYFVSRDENVQQYTRSFWNSISLSTSDGASVDGSVGFVAVERTSYAYGVQGVEGFSDNKEGQGVMCPVGSPPFPPPLNPSLLNRNPIPFWNTKFVVAVATVQFVNWSLDFAQDVVKFFASIDAATAPNDPGPMEPEYLAVGPMTVTFSGAYMLEDPLDDAIADASLWLADQEFKMQLLEKQSISDDVQTGDSTVPLMVEYAVYGIDQT